MLKSRNKAFTLRKKGESIGDIANKLKVSKSTVSYWCRDIKLGDEQIEKLHKKMLSGSYKGRLKFLERVRRERKEIVEKLKTEGIGDVGTLSKRDHFIAGIAMYCSEGANSRHNEETSFYNSNYKIVLFMIKWFKKFCNVTTEQFAIQVRINELHENRVGVVERYWSDITDIPLSQFTKTILIKSKSKKIYPNHNEHYGTVRIMVHRGTQIRRKINGWVDGLLAV